jgi:hypothetical protein
MKVEIKFLPEDGKPKEAKRDSATLVLQRKRDGDYFVNVESKEVIEGGESQTIVLKQGEQLVIVGRNVDDEIVMDSAQNAAVRKSTQTQGREGADQPAGTGTEKAAGPGAEKQPGTNASPAKSDTNKPDNSSAETAAREKALGTKTENPGPTVAHNPSPGTASSKDVK